MLYIAVWPIVSVLFILVQHAYQICQILRGKNFNKNNISHFVFVILKVLFIQYWQYGNVAYWYNILK